jgi:hypothetical protein
MRHVKENSAGKNAAKSKVLDRTEGEEALPLCRKRFKLVGVFCTLLIASVLLPRCMFNIGSAMAQESFAGNRTGYNTLKEAFAKRSKVNSIPDNVRTLCLYEVKDGKLHPFMISRDVLKEGGPIKVSGYVCGILALCEEDMGISVDGQDMTRIKKNGDGTLSAKRFGTLKLEDFAVPKSDKAYYQHVVKNERGEAFLKGGYSLFPEVKGNAIAMGDKFNITFTMDGKVFDVPVEQEGYRQLDAMTQKRDDETEALKFLCVGTCREDLKRESDDLDQRLDTIAEGIRNVERSFGANLMESVNIINYGDIYNAVTSDEGKAMWFYTAALHNEALPELKTIGEHETLHRYVDLMGFTRSSYLREFFADLKGYDDFSVERLLLMTTGNSPQGRTTDSAASNLFFAFINERNFLEGMNGGHSHANIDEFSTSFVHSVMYVDRLRENLNRPITMNQNEPPVYLTPGEKAAVLDKYIKTLEIMIDCMEDSRDIDATCSAKSRTLLERGLREARAIRANGSTTTSQSL